MKNKPRRLIPIMDRKWNKRGQLNILVGLLIGFMVVTILITLIPGFVEMIDMAQNSEALNCVGFVYNGDENNTLSYNATIGTKSTMGCLAMKLYLPYLILAVLIGVVMKILYERSASTAPAPYYG